MGKKKFNTTARWGRCDHRYCGDCATRRGQNRGNRRSRYAVKRFLTLEGWRSG